MASQTIIRSPVTTADESSPFRTQHLKGPELMNPRTLQATPSRCVDLASGEAIEDRLPSLLLTGHRMYRKYLVLVLGIPVFLTFRQFEELLDLVDARLTTATGFRHVPRDQTDHEFVRLQIHRLRKAIDGYTAAGTGHALIQTGAGTEYRLAMPAEDIAVDGTFYELPSGIVPVGLAASLRQRCTQVQLLCNPSEISAPADST
jgi:hypothetical protein